MRRLLLNFLYLFTVVKNPSIKRDYRYYVRDNYYCRFLQYRYLLRDYVYKKPYKTINYKGEFQQELAFILPFAYWHHLNGTLQKTISCKNTRELYFFSNDHEELYAERDAESNFSDYEVPNMAHSNTYSYSKWAQVPLKAQYKNDLFLFEKPILVIANKYNMEWDEFPINFIDIPTLDRIIRKCKDNYQIIYNRPLSRHIVSDNSDILDLKEHQWLRDTYPEVLLMSDLYQRNKGKVNNFNHLQLMVYANCSHFISVHGGTAALASYFGGINIILSKKGVEHIFDEYNTIFPLLSGAKVVHAATETEVLNYMDEHFQTRIGKESNRHSSCL